MKSRERRALGAQRVGDWVLHPDLGLLRSGDSEVRLNTKALQVLLVLLEAGDRGVARDRLLEEVWGAGYPSDAVVSRAVADLRQAFGERAGEQRYIRTLPKYGYQLVASVTSLESEVLTEDALDAAEHTEPTPPAASGSAPLGVQGYPWRRNSHPISAMSKYGIAAFLVAALVGIGLVLKVPTPAESARDALSPGGLAETPPHFLRPLTTAPGIEHQPRFSPDGSWVIYAANGEVGAGWDLYRASVQTGQVDPVAALAGVHEHGPAISPDGLRVAYARLSMQRCDVVIQDIVLGQARPVAPCTSLFPTLVDWSPDGRRVAFTAEADDTADERRRIATVDLGSGQVSAWSGNVSPTGSDYYPRFSPSGRWLAFLRGEPQPDHRATLWLLDSSTLEERKLLAIPAQLGGMNWISDDEIIVSIHDGAGYRLHRLEVVSGTLHNEGTDDLIHPEFHRGSGLLVAVTRRRDRSLILLDADGIEQEIAASTSDEDWGQLSPDGRWVAFVSKRTGSSELWLADTRGRGVRRLTHFGTAIVRYPDWHPSGESLLFTAQGETEERLYQLNLVSEVLDPLWPANEVTTPRWMPDGKRIVAGCRVNDSWHLCIGASGGPKTLEASMFRPQPVAEEALAAVDEQGMLVRISTLDSGKSLIWDGLPKRGRLAWHLEGDLLYYLRENPTSGLGELVERHLADAAERVIFAGNMTLADSAISRSPAGTTVLTVFSTANDDLSLYGWRH